MVGVGTVPALSAHAIFVLSAPPTSLGACNMFRGLNNLAAHACGRGDDVRQAYLADLGQPVVYPHIGACSCLMQPIVLRGGKTTTVRGWVENACNALLALHRRGAPSSAPR